MNTIYKAKRLDNLEFPKGHFFMEMTEDGPVAQISNSFDVWSVDIRTLCGSVPNYEDNEGRTVFTNDTMSLQYFGELKTGVVVFDDRKLRYALDISDNRDLSLLIPLCEVDGIVTGNIHDKN